METAWPGNFPRQVFWAVTAKKKKAHTKLKRPRVTWVSKMGQGNAMKT